MLSWYACQVEGPGVGVRKSKARSKLGAVKATDLSVTACPSPTDLSRSASPSDGADLLFDAQIFKVDDDVSPFAPEMQHVHRQLKKVIMKGASRKSWLLMAHPALCLLPRFQLLLAKIEKKFGPPPQPPGPPNMLLIKYPAIAAGQANRGTASREPHFGRHFA
eukprot:791699-Pelagomonas_calceolata.AAC.8